MWTGRARDQNFSLGLLTMDSTLSEVKQLNDAVTERFGLLKLTQDPKFNRLLESIPKCVVLYCIVQIMAGNFTFCSKSFVVDTA